MATPFKIRCLLEDIDKSLVGLMASYYLGMVEESA